MTQRRPGHDSPVDAGPQPAADKPGAHSRVVACPQCGGDSIYASSNPYRPFCSQRCKNIDFGAWADESFRLADNADPEAQASDDPTHLQ